MCVLVVLFLFCSDHASLAQPGYANHPVAPGDALVEIDGQCCSDLQTLHKLMSGPPLSNLTMTLRRNNGLGEEYSINIQRSSRKDDCAVTIHSSTHTQIDPLTAATIKYLIRSIPSSSSPKARLLSSENEKVEGTKQLQEPAVGVAPVLQQLEGVEMMYSKEKEEKEKIATEKQTRFEGCLESVMLQLIAATDQELDRELGLVSPGRDVRSESKRMDYCQSDEEDGLLPIRRTIENGVTTFEGMKRSLLQLQEELLRRRRQMDLLKMMDVQNTARLEHLDKVVGTSAVKLEAHAQRLWTIISAKILHTKHNNWALNQLKHEMKQKRASERIAANLIATANAKIDELGSAIAEQSKLMGITAMELYHKEVESEQLQSSLKHVQETYHAKELLHKKRVLGKMALRMRNAGMYKAWASWCENAKELQRQRSLLGKIALRTKNSGMYKAWSTWYDNFKDLQRQRSLLDKMALRMRNSGIYKAWAWWCDNTKDLRRQRSLLVKMARRMRNAGIYKAWASWTVHVQVLHWKEIEFKTQEIESQTAVLEATMSHLKVKMEETTKLLKDVVEHASEGDNVRIRLQSFLDNSIAAYREKNADLDAAWSTYIGTGAHISLQGAHTLLEEQVKSFLELASSSLSMSRCRRTNARCLLIWRGTAAGYRQKGVCAMNMRYHVFVKLQFRCFAFWREFCLHSVFYSSRASSSVRHYNALWRRRCVYFFRSWKQLVQKMLFGRCKDMYVRMEQTSAVQATAVTEARNKIEALEEELDELRIVALGHLDSVDRKSIM